MTNDVSEQMARLERRARVSMAIALVGVGLGAVGLYAGLRTRPRPSKVVIEDGQGRLVLTPSFIGLQSRDEERFASIMLDERTRSVVLRLEAGDGAGQVVLTSTAFAAEADGRPRGASSLDLGDSASDAHVQLTTLGTAEGPSLRLTHGRPNDPQWSWTSVAHMSAGPRITHFDHGGSHHAVLQLEADAPPSPALPTPTTGGATTTPPTGGAPATPPTGGTTLAGPAQQPVTAPVPATPPPQ